MRFVDVGQKAWRFYGWLHAIYGINWAFQIESIVCKMRFLAHDPSYWVRLPFDVCLIRVLHESTLCHVSKIFECMHLLPQVNSSRALQDKYRKSRDNNDYCTNRNKANDKERQYLSMLPCEWLVANLLVDPMWQRTSFDVVNALRLFFSGLQMMM